MRWIALMLCLSPLAANAATNELIVSVVAGSQAPTSFKYPLDGDKHELDMRVSHRYDAAFKDTATNRDVCREGMYKTGLLLTLRSLPKDESGNQQVEVIGQVSTLDGVNPGLKLKCGTNQEVMLSNKAFSDTVRIEKNRTKVVVIDGTYTVMVKVE
jgi:hypothetical protein